MSKSVQPNVWEKVSTLRSPEPEIPPDAFSSMEYAKRFQLSKTAAIRELVALVERGALVTAKRRAPHIERMYWPK